MRIELKHTQIRDLVSLMADRIVSDIGRKDSKIPHYVYGVPRGGVPVAYMLEAMFPALFLVVDDPVAAELFVDDLVDSGATRNNWLERFPNAKFFTLIDKLTSGVGQHFKDNWIVFPWERQEEEGVEDNIIRMLQFIGENPNRGGLLETPRRVAKAWKEWCSGYGQDVGALLKTFKDGADNCDEMVMVRDIPFYTHCEHHMAPFFGTATVAYIPNGRIVGLSKIPKVVDVFARRLQVQERLTNQIADAIQTHLDPKAVGVVIKARHLCMESRGINKQGHHTVTSALRGVFRNLPEARAEFLNLAC